MPGHSMPCKSTQRTHDPFRFPKKFWSAGIVPLDLIAFTKFWSQTERLYGFCFTALQNCFSCIFSIPDLTKWIITSFSSAWAGVYNYHRPCTNHVLLGLCHIHHTSWTYDAIITFQSHLKWVCRRYGYFNLSKSHILMRRPIYTWYCTDCNSNAANINTVAQLIGWSMTKTKMTYYRKTLIC